MAKIYPYVAESTYEGQSQALKVKKFMWFTVGQGVVETLSEYKVVVDGKVDVVAYKGDLRIQLQLIDEDAEALSGPCILHLNAHCDKQASYRVEDGALVVSATFGDKRQEVSISRQGDDMTACSLSGYLSLTAYLQGQ